MRGFIILASLVIIVQMAHTAAAQPSGVWVLTNTTTDNGYTEKCSDDTTTCTPPSISAGTVVIPYTINDHHGFFQKYSYTAKWTVPPSVLTPGANWTCTLGLSVEYEHTGGSASYGGHVGMQDSINDRSWEYMQNYAQAHIDMATGDPTPAPASTTIKWQVPEGNMGGVLKLRAISSSGYNVITYYTYTYQASSGQPAPAPNVPPQQTGVDHLAIFPIKPPSSLTENNFVYTNPPNTSPFRIPINFRVTVYGAGNSQVVPDGTEVNFRLVDYDERVNDAYIDPTVGYTTNSEVTVAFYPPTNAYWNYHDPSAENSRNTMTIFAACEGKQTYYRPIEIKPYPEPSTGSTGSTTRSTTF